MDAVVTKNKIIAGSLLLIFVAVIWIYTVSEKQKIGTDKESHDWYRDETNTFVVFINQPEIKGRVEATVSNSMIYFYDEKNTLKWSLNAEIYHFKLNIFNGITSIQFVTNNYVFGRQMTNQIVFTYGKTYVLINPTSGTPEMLGTD